MSKKLKNVGMAVAGIAIVGFALTAAISVVGRVLEGTRYKVGPHGKKENVRLNNPFSSTNETYYSSIWAYRDEWKSFPGWDNKSQPQKDYINRAITNYQWGYSFTTGDQLTNACSLCWQIEADYANARYPITWPLPKDE